MLMLFHERSGHALGVNGAVATEDCGDNFHGQYFHDMQILTVIDNNCSCSYVRIKLHMFLLCSKCLLFLLAMMLRRRNT